MAFIQAKNTYMWKCELHLLYGCKLSARQDVAFIQAKNTYMWKCELHLLHALLLSLEKSKEQHPFLNYKQTTRDKFDQQAIRNC